MSKDWMGNNKSVYTTLGASNHSLTERQNEDYYATSGEAIHKLFEVEDFGDKVVWEPSCGEGHLSKEIEKYNTCLSQDLIDRDYGQGGVDFLKQEVI